MLTRAIRKQCEVDRVKSTIHITWQLNNWVPLPPDSRYRSVVSPYERLSAVPLVLGVRKLLAIPDQLRSTLSSQQLVDGTLVRPLSSKRALAVKSLQYMDYRPIYSIPPSCGVHPGIQRYPRDRVPSIASKTSTTILLLVQMAGIGPA